MKNAKRSPTAINVAPIHEESAFRSWVQTYWKPALGVAVVGAIAILYWEYSRQRRMVSQRSGWERLRGVTQEDENTGLLTGSVADLSALQGELKDTDAAPWVTYLVATNAARAGDYSTALQNLDSLATAHPNHPLVATRFSYGASGEKQSAIDELRARVQAQASRPTPPPAAVIEDPGDAAPVPVEAPPK